MGDSLSPKPKRYVPAVGPWLRPLLWAVLLGFGLLGATGAYLSGVSLLNFLRPGSLYTTPFTFWMFLAHAGIGLALTVPYLLFGVSHWWSSRHRTNRRAVRTGILLFFVGLVVVSHRLRPVPTGGAAPTADRHPLPARHLLAARRAAGGGRRGVRLAPEERAEDPLEVRQAVGRCDGRRAAGHGSVARVRPAGRRPNGVGGGGAVLPPVRGPHRRRQVHPGRRAHERRLLHAVPRRRVQGPPALGPQVQQRQQPGLPGQRERDAGGGPEAGRQREVVPLVRRLPRPGAAVQRPVRRPQVRPRHAPDRPRRHHLRGLPQHHGGEGAAGQRRLHHRGAAALPAGRQHRPAAELDQRPDGEGPAGIPQEDVPQAAAQDGRVLLHLPQGGPAGRAEPLQGLPPRPEPLRLVRTQRHGQRLPQLLLPRPGQGQLRLLPHAAHPVGGLRGEGQRRLRRPHRPPPQLPRGQHRPRGAAWRWTRGTTT